MKKRSALSVNSFIESLVLSDFLIFFAVGLLAPIFAIYLSENIHGGNNLQIIGLATTIYWSVRCITVMPLSRFMDRTNGETDEFTFLITGLLTVTAVYLLYTLATEVWHVYALQALQALGFSMAVPGWRILFTNHLDSGKIGYEWSLEDVAIGLSTALSAYIGALIASRFGFQTLFICISATCFMGAILLLPLRHQMKTKKEILRARKKAARTL